MKLVRYRNLLASLVLFFCLCLKAEASSIPIYEGNPNDVVNIISKIVNVWKVKSLPLRKKDDSICNIYFGTPAKYEHQNSCNKVELRINGNNNVEYAVIRAKSQDTANDLVGAIMYCMEVKRDELETYGTDDGHTISAWLPSLGIRLDIIRGTGDNPFKYTVKAYNDMRRFSTNSGNDGSNICRECEGSGRCRHCGGTGRVSNWVSGTPNQYLEQDCTYCAGSGSCRDCYGTGRN